MPPFHLSHAKFNQKTHLVGAGVLDDLRAEVGGLDGAEILLVRLVVAVVLELFFCWW
jgi:hypothetical protein